MIGFKRRKIGLSLFLDNLKNSDNHKPVQYLEFEFLTCKPTILPLKFDVLYVYQRDNSVSEKTWLR